MVPPSSEAGLGDDLFVGLHSAAAALIHSGGARFLGPPVPGSKLNLDNTAAGAEQLLIDGWANEAVLQFLIRTRCRVAIATIQLTSATKDNEPPGDGRPEAGDQCEREAARAHRGVSKSSACRRPSIAM
jgi:hypothetical protein